jgi:hypothetical protein
MIEPTLLRWVFTVLFAATGFWSLLRATSHAQSLPDRVNALLHLAMSAAMIAMTWPWGMVLPTTPQVMVFTLATGWFLLLMVNRRLSSACGDGHKPQWHAHHALMMASMVWMIATMPMAPATSSPHGGHHHALASSASGAQLASAAPAGPPTALFVISLVLGGYFLAASLIWISAAVDTGRRALGEPGAPAPAHPSVNRLALDFTCHGGMSVGMGVMVLALV